MTAFQRICDCDYLKRLGSNKNETFRETIQRFLTRFPDPVHEIVHGVDYQIISGFFNIFFTPLNILNGTVLYFFHKNIKICSYYTCKCVLKVNCMPKNKMTL